MNYVKLLPCIKNIHGMRESSFHETICLIACLFQAVVCLCPSTSLRSVQLPSVPMLSLLQITVFLGKQNFPGTMHDMELGSSIANSLEEGLVPSICV